MELNGTRAVTLHGTRTEESGRRDVVGEVEQKFRMCEIGRIRIREGNVVRFATMDAKRRSLIVTKLRWDEMRLQNIVYVLKFVCDMFIFTPQCDIDINCFTGRQGRLGERGLAASAFIYYIKKP